MIAHESVPFKSALGEIGATYCPGKTTDMCTASPCSLQRTSEYSINPPAPSIPPLRGFNNETILHPVSHTIHFICL